MFQYILYSKAKHLSEESSDFIFLLFAHKLSAIFHVSSESDEWLDLLSWSLSDKD